MKTEKLMKHITNKSYSKITFKITSHEPMNNQVLIIVVLL